MNAIAQDCRKVRSVNLLPSVCNITAGDWAIVFARRAATRHWVLRNGRSVRIRILKLVLAALNELRLRLSVRDLCQANECNETRTLNRGRPPRRRRLASNQER